MGKFPINLQCATEMKRNSANSSERIEVRNIKEGAYNGSAVVAYWITQQENNVHKFLSAEDGIFASDLQCLFECRHSIDELLNEDDMEGKKKILWLNLACPCRVASHKNSTCEFWDKTVNMITMMDGRLRTRDLLWSTMIKELTQQ